MSDIRRRAPMNSRMMVFFRLRRNSKTSMGRHRYLSSSVSNNSSGFSGSSFSALRLNGSTSGMICADIHTFNEFGPNIRNIVQTLLHFLVICQKVEALGFISAARNISSITNVDCKCTDLAIQRPPSSSVYAPRMKNTAPVLFSMYLVHCATLVVTFREFLRRYSAI